MSDLCARLGCKSVRALQSHSSSLSVFVRACFRQVPVDKRLRVFPSQDIKNGDCLTITSTFSLRFLQPQTHPLAFAQLLPPLKIIVMFVLREKQYSIRRPQEPTRDFFPILYPPGMKRNPSLHVPHRHPLVPRSSYHTSSVPTHHNPTHPTTRASN
ncbi:unnamed protein product [Chondrus crispus]|uniref:Uncharacterized protein n=1 Tax=Chondrus crispus TaxID=2769 RepID=R7Q0K4_CHOCR|nr:unnamed protein product [Chondrus crispus]CDF32182.1 unnamed protein product [Chondrus crispus]|eukprot:XP_005711847.1 unnamed protein product [Chondrus crispus]